MSDYQIPQTENQKQAERMFYSHLVVQCQVFSPGQDCLQNFFKVIHQSVQNLNSNNKNQANKAHNSWNKGWLHFQYTNDPEEMTLLL